MPVRPIPVTRRTLPSPDSAFLFSSPFNWLGGVISGLYSTVYTFIRFRLVQLPSPFPLRRWGVLSGLWIFRLHFGTFFLFLGVEEKVLSVRSLPATELKKVYYTGTRSFIKTSLYPYFFSQCVCPCNSEDPTFLPIIKVFSSEQCS